MRMKQKFTIMLLTFVVTFIFSCFSSQMSIHDEVTEVDKISHKAEAALLFGDIDSIVDEVLNDGTEYSVFLAYPQKSSEFYVYNSQQWRSASMIKVFILAAAMNKISKGELNLDETIILNSSDKVGGAGILVGYPSGSQLPLRQILKLMITESDNTATNIIIDKIGMQFINNYIKNNGYNDTVLQRKMMDTVAINEGRENYSSVNDLGKFFLKLYNHNCVDQEYDEIMLDFLKGQTDIDCFPNALPDKIIAHKTGALNGLYDDGGIIYNGDGDTILVIMTENFVSEYSAIDCMKNFARAVVMN